MAILPVAAVAALFLCLRPLWRAYQVEDLLNQLDYCVPETCHEEVAGLAVMGEDAIDSVATWIADSDVIRRRKAVLVLTQIRSERVSPLLLEALKDEDEYVWETAHTGLVRLWRHSSNPEIESLFRREALPQVERGEWKGACAALDQILNKEPEFAEAHFQRANALYNLGDYDGCMRDCLEALRHNPSHFSALLLLGTCYHRMGSWGLAYDAFVRALTVNPHLTAAREYKDFYDRTRVMFIVVFTSVAPR
jgi:tetratricopeptide (TPR) repeat protein